MEVNSIDNNELCLTTHDFIQMPDGTVRQYIPVYDDLNIQIQSQDEKITENDISEYSEEQQDFTNVHMCEVDNLKSNPMQTNYENSESSFVNFISDVTVMERSSLPPGMMYDVFFSHAYEDREWVREAMARLESPEYDLKCCFADRDFVPGSHVLDNITRSIQASRKTVIVLSPDFLQSSWCDYEIRTTMEMDLTTRRRLLIPVMLRPCRVPEFLGRLTYIEVGSENFWERFVAALQSYDSLMVDPSSPESGTFGNRAFKLPYYHNLDKLLEIPMYQCCQCCEDPEFGLIPNELTSNGIKIPNEQFQEIQNIIRREFFVKYHGCFSRATCCVPFLHFVSMSIFLVGMAMILFLSKQLPYFLDFSKRANLNTIFVMIGLGFGILSLVILVTRLIIGLFAAKRFHKAIQAANEIAQNYNLMIGLKNYGCCGCNCDKLTFVFKLTLVFYFYEWRLCQAHFQEYGCNVILESSRSNEFLQENELDTSENRQLLNITEAYDIEDRNEFAAKDTLLLCVPEYTYLLDKMKLFEPAEQRHTCQGECLCQFVENLLSDPNNKDKLVCVFGVRSRHPWKRLLSYLF